MVNEEKSFYSIGTKDWRSVRDRDRCSDELISPRSSKVHNIITGTVDLVLKRKVCNIRLNGTAHF
jgi:hypothetical protein